METLVNNLPAERIKSLHEQKQFVSLQLASEINCAPSATARLDLTSGFSFPEPCVVLAGAVAQPPARPSGGCWTPALRRDDERGAGAAQLPEQDPRGPGAWGPVGAAGDGSHLPRLLGLPPARAVAGGLSGWHGDPCCGWQHLACTRAREEKSS